MEQPNETQSPVTLPEDQERLSILSRVKKWAGIIWHVPGVKNAALSVATKVLIRIGLPAGLGALIVGVAEAVGSNI